MSAQQLQPASLASAQKRIESLRAELDWTVDSVERLERLGHHDLAVKLVDEQRRSLKNFIASVAQDVSPIRRRFNFRRRVLSFSLGALCLVVAFASLGVAHDRTPLQDVSSRLARAERIADPAGRLRELVSIYATAGTIPGARGVRAHAAEVARHTLDEGQPNDDVDPDLIAQANQMVQDASTGPSTDGSQLQHLRDDLTGS